MTLVEVSIACAEDWKNRDFYPLITIGWVHIKQRGRERQRQRQRQRQVVSTTNVSKLYEHG